LAAKPSSMELLRKRIQQGRFPNSASPKLMEIRKKFQALKESFQDMIW
jgi:hypothetical protein